MKTVLVTGAQGALGSEVVRKFLDGGCRVIATTFEGAFPGPSGPLSQLQGVTWVSMNLTDPKSVARGVAEASSQGPIDGLIHCAGGFRFSMADQISDADLDFLIGTNLKSAFYLVRNLLPQMKNSGFGRIVFVSARATLQPSAGMGAYAASKAGINALVSALAEEVKSHDINVNAVLPTILDTAANRAEMPKADFSAWVPTAELADIIFSLTQPWGKSIHGALIPVAGRV